MKKLSSSIGNDLRLGLPHGQEVLSSSTPAHHSCTRFVNSPLLSVFLLLTMSFIVAALYGVEAVRRAPALPGYDWSQHPNALLLSYPTDDCGCGAAPAERVRDGLKRGLDVVVIAAAPSKSLNTLTQEPFPSGRFALVTNAAPQVIRRFSPGDQPATVLIRHGRIVGRSESGNLPESFFASGKGGEQ